MTAQKSDTHSTFWTRLLPPALGDFPLLTAGEQTKLTWARRIENMDEVPAFYAPHVQTIADRTGSFPYAVLTPSYAQFISRTTEKLVLRLDDEVRVLERVGARTESAEPRVTAFYYPDISMVEMGIVLLKAWIKLGGRTTDGTCTSITIKFNTVGDYLFFPLLDRIRGVQPANRQPADLAVLEQERARFDYLGHDHYKFMNAAKKSIVPGEHVLDSLMQGEIRKPLITLFGHSYLRTLAPAHIVVLTDRELIVITEENVESWGGETRYGSIRTYAPLHKICGAAVNEDDRHLLRVTVELESDQSLSLAFLPDQRPALEQLTARLQAGRLQGARAGSLPVV